MQKRDIQMTAGPLLPNIIRYTVPIILTGLLQLLFNAADLVVVGQFCGSHSVGAVGATSSLINLIVNLFIGLSVGAGVVVAQAIGSGHREGISRTVHTAMPVAVISGLLLTVIGLLLAPQILQWMATPTEYIHLSTLYVKVYFCGMIPQMVYNFGAAILRAAGDTQGPLRYLTLAGVVNVALNVLFVTLFDMNVAGVALATSLSQLLAAVLVVRALMRRTDDCRLEWRRLRIHRTPLLQMLRIGVPAGIQGSLFSVSNVLIQSTMNSFGAVVTSGFAAGGSIEGFVYVVMNAFYQTAMNFTGQNVGAGNYARVRKVMRTSLVSVAVTGLVFGALVWLLAEPLLSLYITDSAEAIRYGVLRLTVTCLPYFLCGLMEVASGMVRGMGASVLPMLVTVLSVCAFRVAWVYLVFPYIGGTPTALFISYPISWGLNAAAQTVIYAVLIRRRLHSQKAREQ
ncbi:MAG: MATE family efflux transporter [Clostridia bacterium]|nr:MATE family efflux transporter [Clostridia bacterium]